MSIFDPSEAYKKRQAENQKLNEAYAGAFSTPDGHLVLEDLCHRCGVFAGAIGEDAQATAYNEGWRSAALYILDRIDYAKRDPLARFQKMLSDLNDSKQAR